MDGTDDSLADECGTFVIRGRSLRFVLVSELMGRSNATVAELVQALAGYGFDLDGRPSKVISDALRWEIRRGRVKRLGWGRYQYSGAPASTARRIRVFGALCHAWIVTTKRAERQQRQPPLPADTQLSIAVDRWDLRRIGGYRPEHPPWQSLGWLWNF